jgi:uncharacterized protein (DUF2141 family)
MTIRLPLVLIGLLAATAAAAAPLTAAREPTCTGPASGTRLTIAIENVRSSQGLIAVTVYPDDPDRFLASKGSLHVGRAPARAPVTKICVHVPQPGTYAIAVYHDEDGNRKLTRKSLGLPAEGYGFANNPPAMFGLPAFDAVRLAVRRTGTETRIRLIYP